MPHVRTNAPKLLTVVVSVVLCLVGVAATVQPIAVVTDVVAATGVSLTREQAWGAVLTSPVLLIVGSILRGW